MTYSRWLKFGVVLLPLLLPVFAEDAATQDFAQAPKEITNSIGMKLRLIPKGKFFRDNGNDRHTLKLLKAQEVEITRPFYIGVYEVTQAQFQQVMGKNPSQFSAGGAGANKVAGLDTSDFPVDSVSWNDAVEFCGKLSTLPNEKEARRTYALPTEAEWEHACRAGASSPTFFHWGNTISSDNANFNGEAPFDNCPKSRLIGRTVKVGSYPPNAWGLYDMSGNVWEWCADWFDYYYPYKETKDPKGPATSPVGVAGVSGTRSQRGGAWNENGYCCLSSARARSRPELGNAGFRVVVRPAAGD